jgi:hypothetical protein
MILATHRPYFAPFPGFFYKAHHADILVILDTVQFPQGTTWISRNRFKNDQGILWLTIPVRKKGLGLQRLIDVQICREGQWARKCLQSLKHAYAHAPYFADHLEFLESIFSTRYETLMDMNMAVMRHIILHLGVETDLRRLSDLSIEAKGNELLIEICRCFGVSTYLAQSAARRFLNVDAFTRAGIELRYVKLRSCIYPQLWGDFIADLSAFDLLFNCGPKSRDILIGRRPPLFHRT